ncbi:hypothetical protein Poli38472_000790 [Pythium oligandrum]|uniref:Acyltransferase n=1 Tax=Pythium oligandrum TaxID=41045 RepID=A0A8K1FJH6_PYTOL|nr:hypothetical protein Poli38472_000790 [Pythium oligandrum]|eukprot:TMW60748.1 hypothetical protein Poli38472_000790 [Pythium oligandrum]
MRCGTIVKGPHKRPPNAFDHRHDTLNMGEKDTRVGGKQTTWPKCVAAGIAALAVCIGLKQSVLATFAWTLLAFYLPSYLDGAEHTGERYWPAYADFCRSNITHGFPMTMECEEEIDPAKQYLFASHPHGILSAHHGVMMTGGSKPSFHDISPMDTRNHLGASVIFRIPIYREYLLWIGCVDASRATAERVLKKGKSLVILVGGIAEQMVSQVKDHTVYVKKRKGHIRLAIKYGVPVVPAYVFGETDLYTHSSFLLKFRQWFAKTFQMALLVAYGDNKWLPWKPHKGVDLHQVFGKPVPVEKNEKPTQEQIDKVHQAYVDELVRVFNKYKEKYGYKDYELKVI